MSALDTIRDALFGNPPVPGFKPSREGVYSAFSQVVEMINSQAAGITVYTTKALMDATSPQPAGKQVRVTSDPTPANNKNYISNGTIFVVDTDFYNAVAAVVQPLVDLARNWASKASGPVDNTNYPGLLSAYQYAVQTGLDAASTAASALDAASLVTINSDKIGGSANYSLAVTTGWPAISGTALNVGTIWVNNVPLSAGYLSTVPLYVQTLGNSAGKLILFSPASGNNWKVEKVISVTVPGAGAVNLVAPTHFSNSIHIGTGWVIGWYAASGGAQLAYNTSGNQAGFSYAGLPAEGATVTVTATTTFKFSMQAIVNSIPYVIEPQLISVQTDLAAMKSNLKQTVGYPGGVIPDGTMTVSNGYFASVEPMLGNGSIFQMRVYSAAGGSMTLQRFTVDNGVTTYVGSPLTVLISGSGFQTIAVNMPFLENEYIGWTGSGIVRFSTGATNANERADGSGTYQSITNGGALGTPTMLYRMHLAFDAVFQPQNSAVTRNVISLRTSDKLVYLRNSYTAEIYSIRGKSVIQKAADLTEWRGENYSIGGNSVVSDLTQIQSNSAIYSYLGIRDVNPTWLFLGELANTSASLTMSQAMDSYRQLIESGKSLGSGIVLPTEHSKWYVNSGIETGPALIRKLANDHDALVLDLRQFANVFSPSIGGYGTDYAGWIVNFHLNIRYSDIVAQGLREFIATNLGRPRTSLRIFRPRPNADGTAPTIANADALLFEPDNLTDRHKKFMELFHGQAALSAATEKYMDEINNGAVAASNYESEYLKLQSGNTVGFTDYAYVEAILGANGRDVSGHAIRVTEPTATVYVRDALYRDLVNTGYPAATAPTGRWRQIGIDSDGYARLTGRNVVGTIFGDKVCWLIAKSGSFVLGEPRIEWYGTNTKQKNSLKANNTPTGSELITNPYLVSGGAFATGWSATGTPTFGTGLQGMLPRGATGHVDVTSADKANVALSWAADQFRDHELEISVWAAVPKALVVSGTYPTVASITSYTNDVEELSVEIIGGTNAVVQKLPVGLYWQELRFRTWAIAGSTGFSLRLSAIANSVSIARVSAKFVD